MVNINDDAEAAWDEAVEFLDRYDGFGRQLTPERRRMLETWVAYGPPQRLIEKVQRYLAVGLTTPILRFCSPDQRAQLRRCLEEVLPAFKHLIGRSPAAP